MIFFLSQYGMIIRLMSTVLVFSSAMCRKWPDPERREEQTKYSRYDTKMYVEWSKEETTKSSNTWAKLMFVSVGKPYFLE